MTVILKWFQSVESKKKSCLDVGACLDVVTTEKQLNLNFAPPEVNKPISECNQSRFFVVITQC